MSLTILSYVIVFLAALFWGKRLYGEWTPAIVLAVVSPIPFAFLVPLIAFAFLSVIVRFVRLFGSVTIDFDSEWVQGAGALLAAVVCSLALRHFARTEGAKKEPIQPSETTRGK
jgi:hypothetical protein